MTIATGDTRAVASYIPVTSLPGGIEGLSNITVNGVTKTIPVAVVSNLTDWGSSPYGGTYFQTVMQQIGHFLGLNTSNDLPGLQAMGNGPVPANTNAPEPVLPGDFDILDGQYLYRPASNDINIYSFTLSTAGTFSAETIAQRAPVSSLLNSVLTLYDSAGNIVARNDDYFGSDSYISLALPAGQYSVAVTSVGNTNFNPSVPDSGSGGTTQGAYDLRLSFNPIPPGTQLLDAGGEPLDGDDNGVAGGDFNFWFQVNTSANTIYVDKSAANGGTGTIASPINNIATALSVAANKGPGTIVRIEGNGGADGNVSTLADDQAYEIGLNILGQPLPDGATMNVPQGVTVMIDAGAVFKLRAANINAGTFAQGLNLSGGSIQVLGTPTQSAYFTSYNNAAIGVPTNPLPGATATPGDWGGIVYQADSDYAQNGVFLELCRACRHFVRRRGGFGGRPAAGVRSDRPGLVAADDSGQHDPQQRRLGDERESRQLPIHAVRRQQSGRPYTADYSRTGPSIHGNVLANNTINGMFIRIRTNAGEPIDVLDVTARLTSTDIVYVLSENLEIQGEAGGDVVLNASGQLANPTDLGGTGTISPAPQHQRRRRRPDHRSGRDRQVQWIAHRGGHGRPAHRRRNDRQADHVYVVERQYLWRRGRVRDHRERQCHRRRRRLGRVLLQSHLDRQLRQCRDHVCRRGLECRRRLCQLQCRRDLSSHGAHCRQRSGKQRQRKRQHQP